METNLKQMETRHCRVTSFINEGTNFCNIEDFKQIKENLKIRAFELKSCVENILSKSLAKVERLEEAHQTSVHKYVNNLARKRDDLEKRIRTCTLNLKSMNPIKLAFYDKKRMQWNQTDKLQRFKIPRFNPRPCKENDMVSLFGFLSYEETTVGERDNVPASRPQTAAPRFLRQEHQPSRIPQTHRSDRRRPNSASFVSHDNLKRFAIGVCESPILIKEFKSCINILFQITYSERLSRVFISGDKPAIYTYKNFLGVRNVESKLEVLAVSKEPQGLAIGLTGNLFIQTDLTVSLKLNQTLLMTSNIIRLLRFNVTLEPYSTKKATQHGVCIAQNLESF